MILMSELNNNANQVAFRPVQGLDKDIKSVTPVDGHVYFATDTKKIYMNVNGQLSSMAENIGLFYGTKYIEYENSGIAPDPNVIFSYDDVEGFPIQNDLILNTDGCFYKVISSNEDDNEIVTTRLTLQGTGGGGGGTGGGGSGSASWSVNTSSSNYIYSSSTESMIVGFKCMSETETENYITHVSFTLGSSASPENLPFYETDGHYAFSTLSQERIHTIDLIKYKYLFGSAPKTVYVNVTDAFGTTRSKKFAIQIVELSLKQQEEIIIHSNNDSRIYSCEVGGTVSGLEEKKIIVSFYSDNENKTLITTQTFELANNFTGNKQIELNLSELNHGVYNIEVQATARLTGSSIILPSNILTHKLIRQAEGNVSPLFATVLPERIEQYTNIPLYYCLSAAPNDNTQYTITIDSNGKVSPTLTVTSNQLDSYSLYFENRGTHKITVTVNEASSLTQIYTINVEAYTGELPVIDPADTSLMLYMDPKGQSNNAVNRDKWPEYNGKYTAELTNMHYSSASGWLEDETGTPYLQLVSGGRLTIPNFYPFEYDPTEKNNQNSAMGSGITIELDFEINGITDYDSELIRCLSVDAQGYNKVGFTVVGNKVRFYSAFQNGGETGALTTQTLVEGKRTRLSFVIEPKTNASVPAEKYFPMCYTYLDGILSSAVMYDKDDKFVEDKGGRAQFRVTANNAQIKIYGIRFYSTALASTKVLGNYIATLPTLEERQARYDTNNVYTNNEVDYEIVSSEGYDLSIPYMVITGGYKTDKNDKWRLDTADKVGEPGLPTGKKDYRLIDVSVVYPKYQPAVVDEQGKVITPEKNAYFKGYEDYSYVNTFDNGLGMTENFGQKANSGGCIMYGQGTSSMEYPVKNLRLRWKKDKNFFKVRPDIDNVEIICMKADYMESSGSHNTGTANLVDDLYVAASMQTPGQAHFDPEGENDSTHSTIVTCIKGHPCLIFYSPTGAKGSYKFVGKYNLNLDKATPQPFGFNHDDDSFGWLEEGEKYWQVQYGSQDEATDEWEDIFIGQTDPAESADYVPGQEEIEATVQEGEKINSIHCFEFLDNAVAVCNFLNKKVGLNDPEPKESKYEIDTTVSQAQYKPNVYYLYNEETGEYELDSSETYSADKIYYSRVFSYQETWYNTFINADGDSVPGWTLGFESRYPEDRIGYHDADMLYPLASWLNELYYMKQSGDETLIAKANERFKREYECHFNKRFLLFYYIVTEALLMVDSRVKNMMIATWGKAKKSYIDFDTGETVETNNYIYYPIFYDMDTMLGLDNTGRNRFNYYDEDTNPSIYNGDEVLWNFVRDNLQDDLRTMYATLEDGMLNINKDEKGIWYPNSLIPYYNTNQANMANEAFYNADAFYKYIDYARNGYYDGLNNKDIAPGVGPYLYAGQGNRSLQREDYIVDRIKFLRGKYNSPDFQGGDYVEFRWNFPTGTETDEKLALSAQYVAPTTNFTFTSLQPCFAGVMLGKNGTITKERFAAEETRTINVPEGSSANNTEAYLLGLDSLRDLGDLSDKYVQKFVMSGNNKLNSLTLGNPHIHYYNPYWSEDTSASRISLDNCTYLQYFNLQNCSSFRTALDFTSCPMIETILLTGSSITNVKLPVNGNVTELRLPKSVRQLTIDTQSSLTDETFSLGTYHYDTTLDIKDQKIGAGNGYYVNDFSALTDICIVDTNIDSYTIARSAVTLNNYYIHGFNWEIKNTDADTQYITTTDAEPVSGKSYYIWDETNQVYRELTTEELTNQDKWSKATVKVTLVDSDNQIVCIPILEQLKTKTGKRNENIVSSAAALSGTITISSDTPITVNEYNIYEKYNAIFPNVTIMYGENVTVTQAIRIKFYNENTSDARVHYEVRTNGADSGNLTIGFLTSNEGPNKKAMTVPEKASTPSIKYTFKNIWIHKASNGVETRYRNANYQPSDDLDESNLPLIEDIVPMQDMNFYPEYFETSIIYNVFLTDPDDIVRTTLDGNYSANIKLPEIYYRDSTDLQKEERWTFKGWSKKKYGWDERPVNPEYITNIELFKNETFYAHYIKESVYNPLPKNWFNYTLNADNNSYTISRKNKDGAIWGGKITLPITYNNLPITTIGQNAFNDIESITHVFFEHSDSSTCQYTKISGSAFAGKSITETNLDYFEMPETITYIGTRAFANQFKLKDLVLNDNITYIGEEAFIDCRSLNITKLPDALVHLHKKAFYQNFNDFNRTNTVFIDSLPSNIELVGEYSLAFQDGVKVTDFRNKNGKTLKLGIRAFQKSGSTMENNMSLIFGDSVEFDLETFIDYPYGKDYAIICETQDIYDYITENKTYIGFKDNVTISMAM